MASPKMPCWTVTVRVTPMSTTLGATRELLPRLRHLVVARPTADEAGAIAIEIVGTLFGECRMVLVDVVDRHPGRVHGTGAEGA